MRNWERGVEVEAATVMLVQLGFVVKTCTTCGAGNTDGVLRRPEMFVHMGEVDVDTTAKGHSEVLWG